MTYAFLEGGNLLMGHGIALGDDGDQVDLVVQALHELDIQGLQRVSSRGDEVQAGIDTEVSDLATVDPVLLFEVGIESALDGLQDGLPAVVTENNLRTTEC